MWYFFAACVVLLASIGLAKVIEEAKMDTRGAEIVEFAQKKGSIWCQNKHEGILALCLASDFKKELNLIHEKIAKNQRQPWERMILLVKPTYTFWAKQEKENLIQVGGQKNFDALCCELVEIATGKKKSDVDKYSFEKAKKLLILEEPRLFVPFAANNPTREEQKKFFGDQQVTLGEAREYILSATGVL